MYRLEILVDQLTKFDDLIADRLEYEFLKAGNIPLTPLGLLKLRPDLAANNEGAKKLIQRSSLNQPERLKALPSLQRWGLIIVEFKAENKGRKRKHQHLFMLEDTVKDLEEDGLLLKAAISKVPIEDWTALLETSGWGVIKETQFFYA